MYQTILEEMISLAKKMKEINLALQGGGSHGAFTWGVLDRLLEEDDLKIAGISGTSAGAINGTVLAYGLITGGNKKARELLDKFWKLNGQMGSFSPLQPTLFDRMKGPGNIDHNPLLMLASMFPPMSPYQLDPLQLMANPIEGIIKKVVDFETIQKNKDIKLFLSATNVQTSKVKVFSNEEITEKTISASTCIPIGFPAVEIDNEYYWDGGYIANPAMFPLFEHTDCKDLMIVQIEFKNYKKLPKTPLEIIDRGAAISFNSSLMREVRAIQFVNQIVDKGFDDNGNLKKVNIHLIEGEAPMKELNMTSKMNASMEFLSYLKKIGREEADQWLKENYDKIGVETSCNVEQCFF